MFRFLRQPSQRNALARFFSTEKKSFNKILVANRGEIAIRVFRTCKKMGIRTVAVHSEADAESLFVSMADESVCVGPAASGDSYLQIDRILEACRITGAEAVHPGYGFLSENNAFAAALEQAGVAFIGPGSYAIEVMGDKIQSKECAQAANVNVIPGDNRVIKDEEECVQVARVVGYPVMVKASAGGGGKGMRIAWNDEECRSAFRLSTNEAMSSFGDDRLFVEKFVEDPRHIEIQVLADGKGNAIWLNERECSIQRRNQKVIEEAPSVILDPETRRAMGEQACQLARAVDYKSAGTVEFLVDKHKNFFFLEMNTRLQVEHPVTEYITGVDLVEQMIRIAAGEEFKLTQDDVKINGWAIESRVYAEDPFKGFLPSIGTLVKYKEPLPGNENVRSDSGIREGAEISVYYDPMICKLITYGRDRAESLELMREALDSYVIQGVKHNIPFLRELCDHPRFISGDITTKFIEEEYPEGFSLPPLQEQPRNALMFGAALMKQQPGDYVLTLHENDDELLFHVTVGDSQITLDGTTYNVGIDFDAASTIAKMQVDGTTSILQVHEQNDDHFIILIRGNRYKVECRTPADQTAYDIIPKPPKVDKTKMLRAPMPGTLVSLKVKVGQEIKQGQEVCVIEAMKMQNVFTAQKDGTVKAVHVNEMTMVAADQLIYELE